MGRWGGGAVGRWGGGAVGRLVHAMATDSTTGLFAARSELYEVVRGVDQGRGTKAQHALASVVTFDASEVADRAVQMFDGRGSMEENVTERFLGELTVEWIWGATSEIRRLIVATHLVTRGLGAIL